jgi:alkanesulfonate monooxygenase SsuD/methylene tetrahydromethanopterin reductase-like flavin-dependent oxidoreductase (luciferase family)
MVDPKAEQWKARATHQWVTEAESQIRFGILLGPDGWSESWDWVQMVEGLGFDSYWFGDHSVAFHYDCWTRLSVMAEATKRIRLGSMVSCVYYRDAALLARHAADVDAISRGRLVLGLGIGDARPEFAQMGIPFPPVAARQRALTETLETVPRLLAGEIVNYEGDTVRLDGAQLAAPTVQKPHVPVLLAGGGEKATLRQVARYADASNFGPNSVTGGAWTPDDVHRKCSVLDAHCADLGRNPSSVLRTFVNLGFKLRKDGGTTRKREQWGGAFAGVENERFDGTPEDAVAYFTALAAAGIRHFIIAFGNDAATDIATLRTLAEEVIPEVRKADPGQSRAPGQEKTHDSA